MRKLAFLVMLFLNIHAYSQEKIEQDIEIMDVAEKTAIDTNEVSFAIIENVPVYKGCNPSLSNMELKKCMSDAISNLVAKNFNIKVVNGLGIEDGTKVRIHVLFKINKKGEVVDITSRAPHPALEKEAIRVIELIPNMKKPGIQRGQPVTVPYALPIIFNVSNPKKGIETFKN